MTPYKKLTGFIRSSAFRSAGIYTFSNFFVKGTAFLLLFVYSNPKFISVEENGLLNLLASAIFILMPFLALGIVQSTSVDFFKLKKEEFKDFFTSSLVIPVIVLLLSIGGLYLFKEALHTAYDFPASFVLIIPALTFLNFFNEQFITLIRNNDEPMVYLKTAILRLFLEISISVTLVVCFAWRWMGRVTGMMIANTVLVVVAFFYMKNKGYLFGRVKKKYLIEEVKYALPIIVMQCSMFCLSSSDRFFLSYLGNNKEVGVYSYASIFASMITIGCTALLSYVMPKIYKVLSAPVTDFRQVRKYFNFYAAGALVILTAVIGITPIFYKFFINKSYYSGLSYLYLIALGNFCWSIAFFFYTFLLYNKQKLKILVLSAIAIIVSLCSNYLLIRSLHAFGAALSTFIGYFVVLLVTLLASYRNVRMIFNKNYFLNAE